MGGKRFAVGQMEERYTETRCKRVIFKIRPGYDSAAELFASRHVKPRKGDAEALPAKDVRDTHHLELFTAISAIPTVLKK